MNGSSIRERVTEKVRATLREWIGADADPCPSIELLAHGDAHGACYLVVGIQPGQTRHGKPYLRVQLQNRSGRVDARVWDEAEKVAGEVKEGEYVGVRGRVEIFDGRRQLVVERIEGIVVEGRDLEFFMPASPVDAEAMEAQLDALVKSVQDRGLRALLRRTLGRGTALGRAFRQSPAAKHNHHAYLGGLLEHTISVAQLCDALARHYGEGVDRDLLVTGALLHDIGKIKEISPTAGFPYTNEGKLLGHILLGLEIVRDEAAKVAELAEERRLLLLHLIASHQGRYEWQSPSQPRLLEALLLHYADDVDAKMHQARALVESVRDGWSAYDRSFAREFLRHLPERSDADVLKARDETLDLFAG